MINQPVKNFFLILFMIATLGSCLIFEQFTDKSTNIPPPIRPILDIVSRRAAVLEELKVIIADLPIDPPKIDNLDQAIEHLVSDEILGGKDSISDQTIKSKISEIAERLFLDVIKNVRSQENISGFIESAIKNTNVEAKKYYREVLKRILNPTKDNSPQVFFNPFRHLEVEATNFLVKLASSNKEVAELQKTIYSTLNLRDKLLKHISNWDRIFELKFEFANFFSNQGHGLLALIKQLITKIEKNPVQENAEELKKDLTKLTNICLRRIVTDKKVKEMQGNVLDMFGNLMADIAELSQSNPSSHHNTLTMLKAVATEILLQFPKLDDNDTKIRVLQQHMPNFQCDNLAINFHETFAQPEAQIKELLKINGDEAKKFYYFLLKSGTMLYRAKNEESRDMEDLLNNALWILDLPLNKKAQLETLMPQICDNEYIKFSKNNVIFKVALASISKVLLADYPYSTPSFYAQSYENTLSSVASQLKGTQRIYTDFLRVANHFQFSEIVTEVKLNSLKDPADKSALISEISKSEFTEMYELYVELIKRPQQSSLENLKLKINDLQQKYQESVKAFENLQNYNKYFFLDIRRVKAKLQSIFDDDVTVSMEKLGYTMVRKLI